MDFSQRTGGAFDIRFNSLSEAGRRGKIEIAAQGASGSLEHPETRLGLGAIAKGYIVEAMSAVLTRQGFPDHLINAGGDLVARGGPWEVALQIPGAAPGKFTRKEKIKNRAVSTSGSYEQGAHILDPRSGKKVLRTGAVTVIAEDPIAADSLATAFFVMGKAAAEIFLKNFPGVEMIWLEPSEM
jgi:thiamine biosynthesis lipoprotein